MTLPVSFRTSSTHVVGVRAAADQEAGERLRHPERDRGQRPLRPVAAALVGSDPEPARVPALHVAAAPVDRVALDRLPLEGVPSAVQSASVPVSKPRLSRTAQGIGWNRARHASLVFGRVGGKRAGARETTRVMTMPNQNDRLMGSFSDDIRDAAARPALVTYAGTDVPGFGPRCDEFRIRQGARLGEPGPLDSSFWTARNQ